jgi:hypothetical protein
MRPEDQKQYELTLKLHGEEAAESFRQQVIKDEEREIVEEEMRRRRQATGSQVPSSSGCLVSLISFALFIIGLAAIWTTS